MNVPAKRPKTVTIIAWLIIAKAVFLACSTLLFLSPDIRAEAGELLLAQGSTSGISIAWALIGAAVRLVCGAAMLRRRNWGRMLYFTYIPTAYLLTHLLHGFQARDLVGLVVFGVFVVMLTRRPASEYFAGEHKPAEA